MLKKYLLAFAVIIALFSVVQWSYEYIWPFIDSSGVIRAGEFRGLQIGDHKGDVIRKATTPLYGNKLRIEAYLDPKGRTILVFTRDEAFQLQDSDIWYLAYPGLHKEYLVLSFEDDRLIEIRYYRNMFAP